MGLLFKRYNQNINFDSFDCNDDSFKEFLGNCADYSQKGICCPHFLVSDDNTLVGFYTISPSCIIKNHYRGKLDYDIPFPLPAWLIGQLAVDKRYQGQEIGSGLLLRAIQDIITRAEDGAGAVIYIDALNDKVKEFYKRFGFIDLGHGTKKMVLTMEKARLLVSAL